MKHITGYAMCNDKKSLLDKCGTKKRQQHLKSFQTIANNIHKITNPSDDMVLKCWLDGVPDLAYGLITFHQAIMTKIIRVLGDVLAEIGSP